MYYVFERGMDRGAGGGEIAREMRGLDRERERNRMLQREMPLSVYMQGGRG